MKEEARRILRSVHDYKGGVTLYITRHDEGAGPVEQPDERRRDARQHQHRHGHDDRYWLRRPQRELLGHQFPDDQRGESGEADDRSEGHVVRPISRNAEQ